MTDEIREGLPEGNKIKCFIENLVHTIFQGPINFDEWLTSSDAICVWKRYLYRGYKWTPITIPIRIRFKPWYKCLTGRFY